MRILVVEDEPDLAAAVARGLRRDGYAVDIAGDGGGALDRLATAEYDLVCLDLNLPDIDGRQICRTVRTDPDAIFGDEPPRVLMLTARDALEDRVGGLDEGADDYLVKPFDFPELQARVRALLRRDRPQHSAALRNGLVELDEAGHTTTIGEVPIDLTAKEFALLRYFMLHPGEVISAEQLLEHVWDEHADPFTNTVRVTLSNLRRKLAAAGAGEVIETVVGAGYRLARRD
ncbi:MAG TPA: response regulator transcription factor [Acidimicrobiia bacterium]|nr:response regulator transcription factor [Acidimicrobiia bacterium]